MRERTRVMVAVDGSIYSAAAINDLRSAGLPDDAEVRVVSVADAMNAPPVSDFDLVSMASSRIDAVISRENTYRELVLNESMRFASEAADALRSDHPGMKISHEVVQGKPEVELLRVAWEWEADLIVTGSHGHSTIKRFLLGSVSSTLADGAETSVRIVPRRFDRTETGPARLLVGVRGTMDAEQIVDALKHRIWVEGAQIRFMVINEFAQSGEDPTVDELTLYEEIAKPLNGETTATSVDIRIGDPESLLLAEAGSWKADSIFIPASSLGKSAAGLVAGTICPVEVVR